MATKTDICNLALSHLGSAKTIATIEERNAEAFALKQFYDSALIKTLRDFFWPFARRYYTLELVSDQNNPSGHAFAYRYPPNCVNIKKILSGYRVDTRETVVTYKVVSDETGMLILTDQAQAVIEYTHEVTEASKFSPDFVMAFSFLLASYIAPRLTGDDPFKMGERALKLYSWEIQKAEAAALSEEQPEQAPEAESIRVRN